MDRVVVPDGLDVFGGRDWPNHILARSSPDGSACSWFKAPWTFRNHPSQPISVSMTMCLFDCVGKDRDAERNDARVKRCIWGGGGGQ